MSINTAAKAEIIYTPSMFLYSLENYADMFRYFCT